MPMELRKLVFSRAELKSALFGYCVRANKRIPAATVTDVVVHTEPEFVATLCFEPEASDRCDSVNLVRSEVAAALIQYSRRIGVPIPRRAKKGIQPAEDGVIMMINLDYQAPKADTV